ncbi:vWA domain-containing protein [Sporosarcina trichiuri]|uniref:vWA domain-containing protein n=1 Tax=Sporosarcina trichiuri TaxID=3056445 RepID=UPI0025B33235|nr:VWA domain-containing protein [Sporosarcina sp. 0.2-SM1T-5]WJY28248.1 VWA domain-containing protein [Sporosarcina sp. 0.2-SM1T-5]
MSKVSRFIQFNDESVETHSLMLYEKIAQSLAEAPYLRLTERQLIEYQPKESVLAMSVFWRHRDDTVTHLGRLSDIYLLSAGFFRQFDLRAWRQFTASEGASPLPILGRQLVMMLEEFRLTEAIRIERPGTSRVFDARRDVYAAYHRDRLAANAKRGFLADALISQLFLDIHLGTLGGPDPLLGSLPIDRIRLLAEQVYDVSSTRDSILLARHILELAAGSLQIDVILPVYTIGDGFEDGERMQTPSGKTKTEEIGSSVEKETIEEEFRAWHRETEDEKGPHLTFDLQQGTSGLSASDDAKAGDDPSSIQQTGKGTSIGNEDEIAESGVAAHKDGKLETAMKRAGDSFGPANRNVTYEVVRLPDETDGSERRRLELLRSKHTPLVKAITAEMRKRLQQKRQDRRESLASGRLSSKLTSLLTEERPKPFYRKSAPSIQLDAVFGLLVDGSASMIDKLDETKEAVLLFHDVLRALSVPFEIASYYEDAYEATKEIQPNYFEIMHAFEDIRTDSGGAIMNFTAHEDNRDGFAIRWMAGRLAKRQERHKFLLVFSDGEPSAFGYDRNGVLDTAEAVWETEREGISVIHLFLSAVETTEEQRELFSAMFGSKTAAAGSVEEFADQTLRILRKLLTIVTQ